MTITDTPTEPTKTTPAAPKRKSDRRPTMTFKGAEFGPEFRALISKAAARQGMTQSAFAAEALTREAHRIIQGEACESAQPPAHLTHLFDEQARRLDALAEQLEVLTGARQRTPLERLRSLIPPLTGAQPVQNG